MVYYSIWSHLILKYIMLLVKACCHPWPERVSAASPGDLLPGWKGLRFWVDFLVILFSLGGQGVGFRIFGFGVCFCFSFLGRGEGALGLLGLRGLSHVHSLPRPRSDSQKAK